MKKQNFIECKLRASSCNCKVTLRGRVRSTPRIYRDNWVLPRKPTKGVLEGGSVIGHQSWVDRSNESEELKRLINRDNPYKLRGFNMKLP